MTQKTNRRSQAWYGKQAKDGFIHRSWMKNQSFPDHAFDGRPIIGICDTRSELSPCNSGLRVFAEGLHGYAQINIELVLQADRGTDLDFLVGKNTRLVKREAHWATDEALAGHMALQCPKEHLVAQDIVDPTLFLAAKASRMMTGQAVGVDGSVVVTE